MTKLLITGGAGFMKREDFSNMRLSVMHDVVTILKKF